VLLREWLNEENHEELFAGVIGKSKQEVRAFLAQRFPRPHASGDRQALSRSPRPAIESNSPRATHSAKNSSSAGT
jgi:hypothetical protein